MATPSEERLTALEAAFAAVEISPVGSVEELARTEQARAARHFGFARPVFRTSVLLRFSGDGVKGHDLAGATAGGVIAGFTSSVDTAGSQLHLPPEATTLYLSPNVMPGSTVLEMFGAPVARAETLDVEIEDAPVDAALALVFSILGAANQAVTDASEMPPIEGQLGRRLFTLVRTLLDGDVDVDLAWTRPRGSTTEAKLTRRVAMALRAHLDADTTTSAQRSEQGTLASVSTAGVIGFTPDSRRSPIMIAAPDSDTEALRNLWARTVEVVWTETVISHPQRDDKKITNELVSIRPSDEPEGTVGPRDLWDGSP